MAAPNIVVVGGSSGMGKAAACSAVKRGGTALLVSRSEDKLERAAEEIRSQKNGGKFDECIAKVRKCVRRSLPNSENDRIEKKKIGGYRPISGDLGHFWELIS